MDPAKDASPGSDDLAGAKVRVDAAVSGFEEACRARAEAGEPVVSGAFGKVPVADYAKFNGLHTRHHISQIP